VCYKKERGAQRHDGTTRTLKWGSWEGKTAYLERCNEKDRWLPKKEGSPPDKRLLEKKNPHQRALKVSKKYSNEHVAGVIIVSTETREKNSPERQNKIPTTREVARNSFSKRGRKTRTGWWGKEGIRKKSKLEKKEKKKKNHAAKRKRRGVMKGAWRREKKTEEICHAKGTGSGESWEGKAKHPEKELRNGGVKNLQGKKDRMRGLRGTRKKTEERKATRKINEKPVGGEPRTRPDERTQNR